MANSHFNKFLSAYNFKTSFQIIIYYYSLNCYKFQNKLALFLRNFPKSTV